MTPGETPDGSFLRVIDERGPATSGGAVSKTSNDWYSESTGLVDTWKGAGATAVAACLFIGPDLEADTPDEGGALAGTTVGRFAGVGGFDRSSASSRSGISGSWPAAGR